MVTQVLPTPQLPGDRATTAQLDSQQIAAHMLALRQRPTPALLCLIAALESQQLRGLR